MDRRFRNPPTRWPTLPEHLLAVIVSRLHSLDDVLRFRSVCKSFRAIVPSPFQSLIPLSVQRTSFPIGPTPSRRCGHFLLTEATVYAIEPLYEVASPAETTLTWLVKIEESDSGEVQLKDPFNGFRFQKLCNKLPKSVNLLDYRIKEITRAYRLELGTIGKGTSRLYSNKVYQKSTIFVKVAVATDIDKFAIMAIHRTRRLFVWKHGDEMLTQLDIAPNDFRDLIFHNKKFYALASTGQTLIVDSMSFGVSTVSKLDGLIGRSYLLKSSENLFMVNRDWEIEWEIEPLRWSLKVFKLDEEKHEWVRVVDGLEDTVLFVGDDCSFSVSAKEFAGCEGNCIYFSQRRFGKARKGNCEHPGMNGVIFFLRSNYKDRVSTLPNHSKIFWPVPNWLDAGSVPHDGPNNFINIFFRFSFLQVTSFAIHGQATPDWSSLPDHVLAAIAKHLQTPIDTLCFRAVCNSFRFSIPPPPKLPSPRPDLKISIPPRTTSRRGHLVLAEITFYAIEPLTKISYPHQTETWVVKMEELNSGKVRLEDPLCRLRLGNLSNKIPKFEKLPESLNLLDYRVKEVAKAFRLEMVAQGKGINRKKPVVYSKAVVCTYQDNRRWGSARCMEKCRQEMAYHRHGL